MEAMRIVAFLCGNHRVWACELSAAHAVERFGQWSLERPEDFVFALSFKRPILFDDRTAASQLAFVCNQEEERTLRSCFCR